ncbi:hypothetical protein SUGI_1051150 [Cryptomeria japonica]|uniref:NDR1/HIN1-like protein 6 n=1 Tax=Cryptomeria japonica TaxID=3369 RepID=UPI002414B571|nr:NDR1/HIN1-like protein 6 [Cryptomeria japonica]GLJ49559.1 hypothetical protein SUGI_1051150 [Cryptomeria japonica]
MLKSARKSWKRKPKPGEEAQHSGPLADESLAAHADDPIGPPPPRTNVMMWCSVIFCAVVCIIIILGGLVVLISYLAFHPHIPKFNVMRGSLNSIILDQSFILSSDATLLIEAHNPNDKIQITYEYIKFELQFEKRTISKVSLVNAQIIQPPKNTTGFLLDMNTVALQLEAREGEDLSVLLQKNRIDFDLKGTIKTKSRFGSITSVKYWVYTSCKLAFSPPPVGNGTLLTRQCSSTK